MSSYTEIDTALLDLDFTNPRIQNYLQNYPEESRSGELLAMLLGTGTDSCASLKESIKEHGGIINPKNCIFFILRQVQQFEYSRIARRIQKE